MPYAMLLVSIVLGAAGQVLIKHGVSSRPSAGPADLLLVLRNPSVVVGFGCYGLATLLYLHVLGSLDLSLAYPALSLGYVLVVVSARLFFGESVSRMRWISILTICAGVLLLRVGAG